MKVFLRIATLCLLLTACNGQDGQDEAAFNDGYAFGYSRGCEATRAEVDIALLDDDEYAREFARGRRHGEAVCAARRAANPRNRTR